ncbi:unnamed protein product, partial [Prorocentrum cordatum]
MLSMCRFTVGCSETGADAGAAPASPPAGSAPGGSAGRAAAPSQAGPLLLWINTNVHPTIIRNIPNAITCMTVLCGFCLMTSTTIPGMSPQACVLLTALGLVADVLDGQAARWLRVKSKFGATFDQMADLCCFGIGPAIFYTRQRLLSMPDDTLSTVLTLTSGYAYMACSCYRIARELIVHDGTRPLYFVGIPTNLACCFVVPVAAFDPTGVYLPPLVYALSVLMVAPVNIPKGLW